MTGTEKKDFTESWNDGYNVYADARDSGCTESEARTAAYKRLMCHVKEQDDELLGAAVPQLLEDFKNTYVL